MLLSDIWSHHLKPPLSYQLRNCWYRWKWSKNQKTFYTIEVSFMLGGGQLYQAMCCCACEIFHGVECYFLTSSFKHLKMHRPMNTHSDWKLTGVQAWKLQTDKDKWEFSWFLPGCRKESLSPDLQGLTAVLLGSPLSSAHGKHTLNQQYDIPDTLQV